MTQASQRSDEVEALDSVAEVRMRDGDRGDVVATLGPVSDQVSESVGVLDRCGHLDGACHVVVRVTQLVRQLLDLVRFSTGGVVHDYIVSWRDYSLATNGTDEEEVVAVGSDDISVDNGSWLWVGQAVRVLAVEETL